MSYSFQPNAARTLTITKSITTNANNTTANVQLFRITGTILVVRLMAEVTTVLGTNHTAAYWRLNDQTAQIALTAAGGTTLSSAPVGSIIAKVGLVAAALTLKSSAAGAVLEPTTLETMLFSPIMLTKKNGANTDIEYTYSTTETPTSGVMLHTVEYISLSSDGAIVAL